ncbi:uncharacterized protein EV420DRAFT_1476890 [Desarmillaria tabescens]|uniref:Uncharacterized protein n=1 Tax=Armillaria tabescens TaxID=1929756 RepID=A0AA39NCK6_ARMTA|nr:uncharacterized protein EV420DRAFT_1476890 [Desarmillaria tabescens]KAK0463162.1 hypothetical protein EV420DRAFT_1476890 [Desarmillaria tabescens]
MPLPPLFNDDTEDCPPPRTIVLSPFSLNSASPDHIPEHQEDSNDQLSFGNIQDHTPSNHGTPSDYYLASLQLTASRSTVTHMQSMPTHSSDLRCPTSEFSPGNSSSNEVIEISSDFKEEPPKEGFAHLKHVLLLPDGMTLKILQCIVTMCDGCKFYYLTIFCGGEHQCAAVDLTLT